MNRIQALAVGLLLSGSIFSSGCSNKCAQLKKQYEQSFQAMQPFATEPATGDDLPVHLGVALRDDLLNDVVDRAVRVGLENALSFADDVSLATGQSVELRTKGEVADLGLYPDQACDECLRVEGRLGGAVSVKLPVLGTQSVPLQGGFSVVAPVVFGRTDDGQAAVKLDLGKAAKLGRSSVDPEITQLPPTWWKLIEAPLSKMMVEAMTKDLPPVTLFTFAGPDLGIEGLEIVPAKLVSDAKRGVVFAGFHTNLNLPEGTTLATKTDLGKNEDIAIGAAPAVLTGLSRAMLASGELSKTWTKDGKSDPSGPIHITIGGFEVESGAAGEPLPYSFDFRAWHLDEESQCWWGDTRASGTMQAKPGGDVSVSIDDVELEDSSMPGIFQSVAKWKASRLFQDGAKVVTKTLDPKSLDFPGGRLQLGKSALVVDGDGAWLRAKASAAGAESE